MGLEIEIVERSSVIVVTISGGTPIEALEPLHDALRVAANEGQTVVVDLSELTDTDPLGGIIDTLGPAAPALKLVARPSPPPIQVPGGHTEIYPSVDAAISAARGVGQTASDPTHVDLAAKFDALAERYAQMINHCRQLLAYADGALEASARTDPEP